MILSMGSVSQWVSKLFGCNGIMHSCSPDGPQKQERRQFNCILRDNGKLKGGVGIKAKRPIKCSGKS